MTLSALAAIIILLASVVLSQKIGVDAGARLDDSMKLKMAQIFPKRNVIYTIVIYGIVILFLIALYALPKYFKIITMAYGVAFTIYIFTKLFLNVKKLKDISAPEPYTRSVIISFAVFIGGAVAAGIVLAIGSSGFSQ